MSLHASREQRLTMSNFLEMQLRDTDLPVFNYVVGSEKLSFTEHLKEWFSGIYLAIQKVYAKFTFNIHKVDMNSELSKLANDKELFYRHGNVECPTPEYFIKSPDWMSHYVASLADAAILMDVLNTETEVMYSRMKKFASSGVVPSNFRFVVTDTERVIDRAENFMKGLMQTRGAFTLKEVYTNPGEIVKVTSAYNQTVRNFKARDSEMLSRGLKRVYDISSLVIEKMKVGDIVVTENETRQLTEMFQTYSNLTNITGAMLVLLNEFSAVMTDTKATLAELK